MNIDPHRLFVKYIGLPSNRIVDLAEGQDGSLWMVTEQRHLVRFKDGSAKLPGLGGYAAAMINSRFMASDVWTTEETVARIAAVK